MNNKEWKSYSDLAKLKVVIPVGLSGFTGFLLYNPGDIILAFLLMAGVILQAGSASTINQILERQQDRLMPRTQNRPLASGKISQSKAWLFSLICFSTGSFLLIYFFNYLAFTLGCFSLIWYILVYTELKKITPFAVIPGSVTGAIPPLMGWTAAGGHPFDTTAVLLAFLFFIGQVPHFWLLILKYGDEYEKAGFPGLKRHFNESQIKRLSFTWIMTSLASALLLAFFGILEFQASKLIMLIVSITGIFVFRDLAFPGRIKKHRRHFLFLNLYFMIVMLLLISDKMIFYHAG